MKKAYETPMVEMIAFNYRDQVVAASGGTSSVLGDNSPTTGEQIIGRIMEGFGVSGCAGYECTSLANYG